jgi:multiple sugar transport system permease protein
MAATRERTTARTKSWTRRSRVRRRPSPWSVLAYGVVLLYAVAMVLPLYYVLISAFKTNQAIFDTPLTPPASLRFDDFRRAEETVHLLSGLLNSAIVTAGTGVLTLVLAVLAAFGIARTKSRFAAMAETSFGVAFLIPVLAVLIPVFLLAAKTGLINTPRLYLVMFYTAMVLPLSVLIMVPFFRSIPDEIEDAATMDGASRMRILWHVMLPLVAPGVSTVAILNFLGVWNEYLFASVLTTETSRTVQVALPFLRDPHGVNFGLVAAGTIITLLPVYVVYAILQHRLHEALVAGSVKG